MKAVWINPLSTGGTSLDDKLNPHDTDQLGLTYLLQREGFEVWLQEAFAVKRKQSNWDKKLFPEDLHKFDADVAIIACNTFLLDYACYRYWGEKDRTIRAKRLDMVTDWLDKFKGKVYTLIVDPRPNYQKIFFPLKKKPHSIVSHLRNAQILVADPNFLAPELRPRAVTCDYWRLFSVGEPRPYCKDNDYFCTYAGLKYQNGYRRNMITSWLDKEGCYTVGQIELKGVPSLTNYENVSLSEVLDYTTKSTTALVCGEKTHTWLQPRVVQSMMCGTIASIHPDFAGSHHFPPEILAAQRCGRASEFDIELSERVYNRQVEFIMSLRDSNAVSGVS